MLDRHNMGESLFVPKIKGESWYERHRRREVKNDNNIDIVLKWCDKHHICFGYYEDSWQFYADGKLASWTPLIASLVLNHQKNDSLHIHDYKRLLRVLSRYFGLPLPSPFELANYEKPPKR